MNQGSMLRRATILSALIVMVGMSAVPSAAVAHPPKMGTVTVTLELVRVQDDPDLPAPEPGAAVANVIGYDFDHWAYKWKCSYAGWDSISVSWTCRLRAQTGTPLSEKSGKFYNGWYNPGEWWYFIDPVSVCVVATAWYTSYPGQSDSSQHCK